MSNLKLEWYRSLLEILSELNLDPDHPTFKKAIGYKEPKKEIYFHPDFPQLKDTH